MELELTGDDHLERAVTELGEPEALFRVSGGRFAAKLGLGVLLVAFGLLANYLWWVPGPARFDFVSHLLFFLPISGLALLLHMYRNRGLFALVYPTGLLRLRHGEVDSFPWNEVDRITVRIQRAENAQFAHDDSGNAVACWLHPDAPTFKLWNAGVTVTRSDGVEAHFGPALSDYEHLAVEVQKRTFAALWPALRRAFRDGETVAFGELELDRRGLRFAGKHLPWSELKELTVGQGKLSAKQAGKWLPWALIDMTSVPNPHLLFALVDEARRTPSQPPEQVTEQREVS